MMSRFSPPALAILKKRPREREHVFGKRAGYQGLVS